MEMKKSFGFAIATMIVTAPAFSTAANAQQLPPAKPGECYARCLFLQHTNNHGRSGRLCRREELKKNSGGL
jgi:hypothetical protein